MKCKDCEFCIKNKNGLALCTFNGSWEPTQLDTECGIDTPAKPLTCGDCSGIYEDVGCTGCAEEDTCPQEGCTMNLFKGEIALHEFLERLEATGYDICQYLDSQKQEYLKFKEKCKSRYKFQKDKNILDVYIYGDRTYGITNDLKYVVVTKDKNCNKTYFKDAISVQYFTKKEWNEEAKKNKPIFLECVMTLPQYKLKEAYIPKYKINNKKVFTEFMKESQDNWNIGKQKFPKDKKYIWNAFNILFFAQDILSGGRINYMSSLNYYHDIMNNKDKWDKFAEHYETWYERVKEMTEFCLKRKK